MAALPQPAPGGAPSDPAGQIRSILKVRAQLEALFQKYQSDTQAAQSQALAALGQVQTLTDFNTQMDKITQADQALKSAKDKKEAEVDWLDDRGKKLIIKNRDIADSLVKEFGKSDQLTILQGWVKSAKKKGSDDAAGGKANKKKATKKAAGSSTLATT